MTWVKMRRPLRTYDRRAMSAKYYAAYHHGEFDTPEAAFERTKLPPEKVTAAIARGRTNAPFAAFIPIYEGEVQAMVTERDGRYHLWRAFTGYMGTEKYARRFIKQFDGQGLTGTWAIFQYQPPAQTRH